MKIYYCQECKAMHFCSTPPVEAFSKDAMYYDNPKRLPCIDIGKWISQFKDDFILLKMNIEGAEYQILEHMIKDGSIKYVDELYVQFHDTDKIKGITKEDTAKIVKLLKDNGIEPKIWDKRHSLFKDYL